LQDFLFSNFLLCLQALLPIYCSRNTIMTYTLLRVSENNKNFQTKLLVVILFMANQRTIDEILGKLQPAQKEAVQSIRELIKNTVPETQE